MQDKQIAWGSGLSEDPLKPEPHGDSTSRQTLPISSIKLRRRQAITDAFGGGKQRYCSSPSAYYASCNLLIIHVPVSYIGSIDAQIKFANAKSMWVVTGRVKDGTYGSRTLD
jgi:hypothetical protein